MRKNKKTKKTVGEVELADDDAPPRTNGATKHSAKKPLAVVPWLELRERTTRVEGSDDDEEEEEERRRRRRRRRRKSTTTPRSSTNSKRHRRRRRRPL